MTETPASSPTPAVSVLMAVHNSAQHLRATMQSVLEQTFGDFEFVIVDDCSTDETPAILDSYDDGRIVRLRNEQNLSLPSSLNRGAAICRAPLIARIDGDDICAPTRLAEQVRFMQEHPDVAAAATWTTDIDDEDRVIGGFAECGEHGFIAWDFFRRSTFYHPTTMMRAVALREVGGYDEGMRYAQDYDLFTRMVMAGHRLMIIERPLVRYRRGAGSISQRKRAEQAALAQGVRQRYHRHWFGEEVSAEAIEAACAFMGWDPFDWNTFNRALPLIERQRSVIRPHANTRAAAAIDAKLLEVIRRQASQALRDAPSAASILARCAMGLPGQRFKPEWWRLAVRAARARFGRWRRSRGPLVPERKQS